MKAWHTKKGYTVLRVLSGRCNVFAVLYYGRYLLVDTGIRPQRWLLKKRLKTLRREGNEPAALIMTHAHFDHAGSAAAIAAAFHIPVYCGSEDEPYLRQGCNAPICGAVGFARLINCIPAKTREGFRQYESVPGVVPLENAVSPRFPGFPDVTLIRTPGHTPGSVSVIVDGEIAIVGDTMYGVFPGSAYPPFAQDKKALMESWGKLAETGCGAFLPSHGSARARPLAF